MKRPRQEDYKYPNPGVYNLMRYKDALEEYIDLLEGKPVDDLEVWANEIASEFNNSMGVNLNFQKAVKNLAIAIIKKIEEEKK